MSKASIKLDLEHHSVSVDGQTTALQQKTFEVLRLVVEGSPNLVSRKTLIDAVWNGNHWTGEKGLNQAMWQIRAVLHDNAKTPLFIKTVPRQGYQWLQGDNNRAMQRVAAAIVLLMLAATVGGVLNKKSTRTDMKGTQAYLVNDKIVVDMDSGCQAILKPSGIKRLESPVLSVDGRSVAFRLMEAEQCRLITLEFVSGDRQDFGACPEETHKSQS